MEKELYKIRSLSACIHDAFELYCNNFSTIFKCTWLPALILSLAIAITNMATTSFSQHPVVASVCSVIALWSIMIFLGSWIDSKYIRLLNKQSTRVNYRKCLNVCLFFLALTALLFTILMVVYIISLTIMAHTHIALMTAAGWSIAVIALIVLVVFFLFVPFLYAMVAYVMAEGGKMKSVFKQAYRIGWKHYGFLFGITAISALIAAVLVVIVSTPTVLLYMSSFANNQGVALGDASALPSTFFLLKAMTDVITYFGCTYLAIWLFFVQYYAYGSITTREQERSLQNTNTHINE